LASEARRELNLAYLLTCSSVFWNPTISATLNLFESLHVPNCAAHRQTDPKFQTFDSSSLHARYTRNGRQGRVYKWLREIGDTQFLSW